MNLRDASEPPLDAENVHSRLLTAPAFGAQQSSSEFPDRTVKYRAITSKGETRKDELP